MCYRLLMEEHLRQKAMAFCRQQIELRMMKTREAAMFPAKVSRGLFRSLNDKSNFEECAIDLLTANKHFSFRCSIPSATVSG